MAILKWLCGIIKLCSSFFVVSLILSILSAHNVMGQGVSMHDQSYLMPAPTVRVYLFSFERGFLLQITDTPNTDVILTKPPGYFEAYMFECNASYPIQWVYLGEGAPIITGDVGRTFREFFDPGTYTYHTSMIMYHLYEQNSGRYACRGIERTTQKLSVYLHLYVPGNDILISTAEKSVQLAPNKDQITLPCQISDPTQADQINLYKGNHKGSYKRIETNSSISYNPRKGFRLQRQQLQDIFGKYLCVAGTSKKRTRIQVIPKIQYRMKRQVLSNEIYGISEALQFSYDGTYHRMLCCASSGVAPKLTFAGCTSIVDCELKSACFRENKCEKREGELTNNGYYNHYIGLDPQGCTGYSLRNDPNGDFGLLLCTDHSNAATQYQPFLLNRGNLFMSFDQAPPAEKVMTLSRATDEELFVGSETMFRCNSSRFFFGTGVRWAFERADGDLEFVEDSEVIRDVYFITAHRRHSVLRIPHANIKSVVCVTPVWNSATEWRILSFPISVSRIFHPPTQSQESTEEISLPQIDFYEEDRTQSNSENLELRRHLPIQTTYAPQQQRHRNPAGTKQIYSERQPQLNLFNGHTSKTPYHFEILPSLSRKNNGHSTSSSNQYFYRNVLKRNSQNNYQNILSPQSTIQPFNSTHDLISVF